MRTTIDLPDDLHRLARSLARDTSRTFSEAVADLIRRGLRNPVGDEGHRPPGVVSSPRSGLPVVHLGRIVTSEDVRSLEDDPT